MGPSHQQLVEPAAIERATGLCSPLPELEPHRPLLSGTLYTQISNYFQLSVLQQKPPPPSLEIEKVLHATKRVLKSPTGPSVLNTSKVNGSLLSMVSFKYEQCIQMRVLGCALILLSKSHTYSALKTESLVFNII